MAMALRLLLGVSWIVLLFNGSVGLPAIKGYGYPYTDDSRNIGDDGEDEALTSPAFDQSNWQAPNNQPAGPVSTSYNKPAVALELDWAPSQQNLPNTPSDPQVERLVNGVSRDWALEDSDKPLVFPLNNQPSEPAAPQPGGGSTHSASPTTDNTLSSTSAKSPGFESWQHEPVSSIYGVVDFNTGSSAATDNIPHLVYEDVFKYPSENREPPQSYGTDSNTVGGYGQAYYMSEGSSTGHASPPEEPSLPSYPTNVVTQPVYPSGTGGVKLNLGQMDNKPRNEKISRLPQQPVVSTQKVEVSQRVSEPILPPAPPQSYIVQSRNAYQRGRYILTNSKYSPEFTPVMPVSSKVVKGPAPLQPAAPKGVKNP